MDEKIGVMKLSEVRKMNALDGEKLLVWKLNVDRYTEEITDKIKSFLKEDYVGDLIQLKLELRFLLSSMEE